MISIVEQYDMCSILRIVFSLIIRYVIIFYLCFLFSRDAEEKVKKSVDRILGIWEERAVYSKHFIEQIRLCKPGGIIGFKKQY